eukprot:4781860-Alexandrium_andersonii.AAC.1
MRIGRAALHNNAKVLRAIDHTAASRCPSSAARRSTSASALRARKWRAGARRWRASRAAQRAACLAGPFQRPRQTRGGRGICVRGRA